MDFNNYNLATIDDKLRELKILNADLNTKVTTALTFFS